MGSQNFLKRGDDLRSNYKVRRTRQLEFIRSHPDTDVQELAQMMIDQRLYAPAVNREMAASRILCERQSPSTIGPRRRLPILTIDEQRKLIAEMRKSSVANPREIENTRRKAIRSVGKFLEICGWKKMRPSSIKPIVWVDPADNSEYRVDVAFFVANLRALELARIQRSSSQEK